MSNIVDLYIRVNLRLRYAAFEVQLNFQFWVYQLDVSLRTALNCQTYLRKPKIYFFLLILLE